MTATRLRRANYATALLILCVLPPLTSHAMPRLIQQHNWLLFDRATAAAIAAMSLNLLLGYAGQISLGHAGLLGVGAFTAGNFTTRLNVPMFVGIVVAIVVSALVALLIAFHIYLGLLMRDFAHDRNRHGHVFYRWLNEIPALPILVAIVFLVVMKPF